MSNEQNYTKILCSRVFNSGKGILLVRKTVYRGKRNVSTNFVGGNFVIKDFNQRYTETGSFINL